MTSEETIAEELAALKHSAPSDVLDRVMRGADLADEFTEIEGPTGPAYVAWNGRGITAFVPVDAVGTPEAFKERHPRGAFHCRGTTPVAGETPRPGD